MGQTIVDELLAAIENEDSQADPADYGFLGWHDVLCKVREVMVDLGSAANQYNQHHKQEVQWLRERLLGSEKRAKTLEVTNRSIIAGAESYKSLVESMAKEIQDLIEEKASLEKSLREHEIQTRCWREIAMYLAEEVIKRLKPND